MQIADRGQRVEPLRARLADADQDAGGERHRQFAGAAHRLQPRPRAPCPASRNAHRPARTAARCSTSSMMPMLADTVAERRDFFARHDARIDVGQQAGLVQHQRAHRAQVLDGRLVTQRGQGLTRGAIAQFRLVAQGEQRLCAACGGACPRDRQHRLGRQIRWPLGARAFGERAVVAHVATQFGQRDEDLARIGHRAPLRSVTSGSRARHQVRERFSLDVVHHALRTTSSPKRWSTSNLFSMVGRCG